MDKPLGADQHGVDVKAPEVEVACGPAHAEGVHAADM